MYRHSLHRIMLGWYGLVLLSLIICSTASAQNEPDRSRQLARTGQEEDKLYGLEPSLDDEEGQEFIQDLIYDYGGLFRYSFFNYDDGEDTHILRTTDLRLWGNLIYKDMHQVYVRVKGELLDYNAGTQYSYMEENNQNYPRLDIGYYQVDLARIFDLDVKRLRLKAGRDYIRVGEGLALDRRGEGAYLEFREGDFNASVFIVRSIKSEDALDRSHPKFGHDRRLFSGFEVGYKVSREMELFGHMVFNRNRNREFYPEYNGGEDQKFGHESTFRGIGVRGEIGPSFTYFGEYVQEYGNRYSDATPKTSDVDAFAYNTNVEYAFRSVTTQPKISAQYVYASGDQDAGNTLDTLGGNLAGSDYDSFTNYGFVNTGVVFFPRLANVRVFRVGGSFSPLYKDETYGDIEIGVNAFIYRRNERTGGISDRFATNPGDSHLGKEIDIFALFRPFSDLNVMIQYGIFKPDQDVFNTAGNGKRHYFSIGTTVYF